MGQISCIAPTLDHLADLIDLDRRSLGGLWSEEGYRRELDSPNSCIRVLSYHRQVGSADPSTAAIHSIDDHGQELAQEPALEFLGLGCYWAIVDEAHITLLGIDPRYQRRGLGQWLLIHLLEDACDRGMARATLEVRASNQGAIRLYQSFGFETLGTRKRYYPDGEDALVLWQNSLQTSLFQENLRSRRMAAATRLGHQGWQIMAQKDVANRT